MYGFEHAYYFPVLFKILTILPETPKLAIFPFSYIFIYLLIFFLIIMPVNTIYWTRRAAKQLRKIARPYAKTIYEKVTALKADQRTWKNVTKLTNHTSGFRLRVGRYRVLFSHDEIVKIVNIEEVKKRDEQTY
jgi:mRNA-degrading endonuclease RelE of RelBE toxin-antitoxin system